MVVIATEAERELANKFFPNEEVLVTGVGGTNVIKCLAHMDRGIKLKNVGYAGSNSIRVGESVKIGRSELHRENTDYKTDAFSLNGEYTCYTSNDFVVSTTKEEPCVFDMELAFICALGFNVESVKVISDNLNYKQYEEKAE